ncbi:Sodium-dependent transporter [Minicystis rosea]|nr:Sodium-dependent transporter [Minicystis rosea]
MQANVLTAVLMPAALGIIMLGLGLGLTPADFRRVLVYPRAVLVGLVCQTLLLPLVCFGIARGLGLSPELAVGLMLLSAAPGGATANLFSHLAKGDVALNITLVAVNSILGLFTLPFIVNLSLAAFMGEGRSIPLQPDKVIQVFAIVLVPVGIGMLIKSKRPSVSTRLERPVKILSGLLLALIIIAAVIKERSSLVASFREVGAAALLFNLSSLAIGYLVPIAARLPKRQATAIAIEIGIHNGTLAIAVASSPLLLNNGRMAIPPAVYSIIMFFTAATFSYVAARNADPAEKIPEPT